jgi:hypothetical protein
LKRRTQRAAESHGSSPSKEKSAEASDHEK